jgi:drug/metabolite transporter (DMT)-like permease
MAVSALGFCVMAVFVRRLSSALPQFELVFFRSLINLALVLAWLGRGALRAQTSAPIRWSWILFGRGVAGFIGISCMFYSVSHLPLSVAMLLSWSSPLFVLVFSRLLLKEKVNPKSLLWIAGVFLGLDLLLGRAPTEDTVPLDWFAVSVGLLGACFAGLAYVAVRAASQRQVSSSTIVLYLTAVATAFSLPLAVPGFIWPTFLQWAELLALGACATVGQVFMTQAYRHARAGVVSTMGLLNAAFSAVLGWWLFGETLDGVQWTGLAMMGFSLGLLTLSNVPRESRVNLR